MKRVTTHKLSVFEKVFYNINELMPRNGDLDEWWRLTYYGSLSTILSIEWLLRFPPKKPRWQYFINKEGVGILHYVGKEGL